MGCKPNKKIFINSMEEVKMEGLIQQCQQIQQMNQLNIHTSSIKKQNQLFPENPTSEKDVLKDQMQISQFFSFRHLTISTISPTPQPFSPDLTPQILVKYMDSNKVLDQSSISKVKKQNLQDKLFKQKRRKLDMKELEAQF